MFNLMASEFACLVESQGGKLVEDFREDPEGYLSAYLPVEAAVQPGDQIKGGLALKRKEEGATLHGFVLRLVCTNGMVRPRLAQKSETLTSVEALQTAWEQALAQLSGEPWQQHVHRWQESLAEPLQSFQIQAAFRQISHMLGQRARSRNISQRQQARASLMQLRAPRSLRSPESSAPTRFDLVNAITEMAHFQDSPAVRWDLMALGGEWLHQEIPKHQEPQPSRSLERAEQPLLQPEEALIR